MHWFAFSVLNLGVRFVKRTLPAGETRHDLVDIC